MWKLIYAGKPDRLSVTGIAQPSWHSFDKREWRNERGFSLVLSHNTRHRRKGGEPHYKIEMTNLFGEVIKQWKGDAWQRLVKEALRDST